TFSNINLDSNGRVSSIVAVLTKSTDKGNSFSPQVLVSTSNASALFPFVIVDNQGKVNVTWQDLVSSNQTKVATLGIDDGGGDGGGDQDGNIKEGDSGNFDIFYARSTDGGLSFTKPSNLSFNVGESRGAHGG